MLGKVLGEELSPVDEGTDEVIVGAAVIGGGKGPVGLITLLVGSGSSRQPQNLPGMRQEVDVDVVVVVVGSVEVVSVVVVLSLHPNHPGVLHVDVEVEVVVVVVVVGVPVVLSRHPHHPGVWQVDVRVLVRVVAVELEDVVVSVPLLSYIFHWAQSRHSGVSTHSGTSSYFMITSWMTDRILWVPIPTRHPLSATTS